MIDLNNTTVEFARKDFGDVLKSANVCDAANLHLFGDRSFDLVHSAQTFEHFRPELVPFILAELYRVLKPGGLLFTSHDTFELYDRQGRKPEHEDPTHVCVWPRMMWDHLFREAGFVDKSQHWRLRLEGHNLSFLKRYDWDWWVLERPGTAEVSDDPQNRA
jgi:predicted SAM-dependent methyltransferase